MHGFNLVLVPSDVFEKAGEVHTKLQHNFMHSNVCELVPWMELTPERWYSMIIEGERLNYGNKTKIGQSEKDADTMNTRIEVRIDYFDAAWEANKTEQKQLQPEYQFSWTGPANMHDVYTLGNVFNNLCSDAPDNIHWGLGAVRNVFIFALHRGWTHGGGNHEWEDSPKQLRKNWVDLEGRKRDVYELRSPRSQGLSEILLGNTERVSLDDDGSQRDEFPADLRYFLRKAMDSRDGTLTIDYKGISTDVIVGKYKLNAKFRRKKLGSKSPYAILVNDYNIDHEEGFIYSTAVIYRHDMEFLAGKEYRTTKLIRALLASFPVPESEPLEYWQLHADLEMDANTLFIMRGQTARIDVSIASLVLLCLTPHKFATELSGLCCGLQSLRVNSHSADFAAAWTQRPVHWPATPENYERYATQPQS